MLDGTEYFECQCHSDEHAVTFTLSLDDEMPEIYLSVYMDNRRGFWRRLWLGLRYARLAISRNTARSVIGLCSRATQRDCDPCLTS
jgi:hypothetical protein